MTTRVLFLCPHGAGKSILAATYFRSAAARIGLDADASAAGTEPDDAVMPNVRAALTAQGFDVPTVPPRLVTPDELRTADVVVNIGCDPATLVSDGVCDRAITSWEVPLLSIDFDGAVREIHRCAELLATDLKELTREGAAREWTPHGTA